MGEVETGRSEASRSAILGFLRSRVEEACFLSEVVAALRNREIGIEQAEACLRELHEEGEVWLEEFVAPDPHLPSRVLIASVIDPSLPAGAARDAAQSRAHQAFEAWFREFLMTHRCV